MQANVARALAATPLTMSAVLQQVHLVRLIANVARGFVRDLLILDVFDSLSLMPPACPILALKNE